MRLRLLDDERGAGLLAVVASITVLLGLVSVATSQSVGTMQQSRRDQDWQAALAAAQAGVDDYVYRINRDSMYYRYGVPGAATCGPDPCVAPPEANLALEEVNGTDAGWAVVPGRDDPTFNAGNEAFFHYDVDASTIASDGTIELTATGRVRNVTRTVQATVRRKGVLDYLYFTNYEVVDPTSYGSTLDCAKHYGEGRSSQCIQIWWGGTGAMGDTVNGPFHTNDAIHINGDPVWTTKATTAWPGQGGKLYRTQGNVNPSFPPGYPKLDDNVNMPTSNAQVKVETEPGKGGCLYTGPTKIELNPSGKMRVNSPYTRSTNPGCLGSNANQWLDLPENGVIYVQDVPGSTSDPNYGTCTVSKGNALGYPIPGDVTSYSCLTGDAFVKGKLKGQLTIAAQNDIVIVGNIRYSEPNGTDLLGLVADNFIEVYHPVSEHCYPYIDHNGQQQCYVYYENLAPGEDEAPHDYDIHAALLSLRHSYMVQNYGKAEHKGTLNVFGAIAQEFRGPVALSGCGNICTGYSKNYDYDERLQYLSPPHFIQPLDSPWEVKTWSELDPAY